MRPKENYKPFITITLGLMLAILVIFQVYIVREPARIQHDEAADQLFSEREGQALYAENCAACHGEDGQGGIGPALNSRDLLTSTIDKAFFGLIGIGIPGTSMPAWGQVFGGPFTDEQLSHLVAYIRSWEETAPKIEPFVEIPDPARGAAIYEQTCFICHGEDGQGSDLAPALNDMDRLQKFDDSWYKSTIARGRPAKGMPTWGTVLSPSQINDVVALLGIWRSGESVQSDTPLATFVTNALFAIREFDRPDAAFYLRASQALADKKQAEEIKTIIGMIEENHLFEAESRLVALLPPAEMGRASFSTNCAPCHGDDGSGGMGANLHTNSFIQAREDEELIEFILDGRRGTAMDGFEGILGPDVISNVIVLLREWQE